MSTIEFGATVAGVQALLPTVPIRETVPAGHQGVTTFMVEGYIAELSGRLALRLVGMSRLARAEHREALVTGGRDAIHNGAASYTHAARHPEQASGANREGYSQVLWARWESATNELAGVLEGWLSDPALADTPTETTTPGAAWSFPPPRASESMRF